jgi:hypothetical protein
MGGDCPPQTLTGRDSEAGFACAIPRMMERTHGSDLERWG